MKRNLLLLLLVVFSLDLFCQVHWTKHPENPVLSPGSAGEWDDASISYPQVIHYDNTYHMWYQGSRQDTTRIGHATSPDGITWTKDANNPVMDVGPDGAWDDKSAYQASVLLVDSVFHMWYNGDTTNFGDDMNQIGHATSADGISWTKDPNNPVLSAGPSGTWDDTWSYVCNVVYSDGTFHMWYSGYDGSTGIRIGHATSPDGVAWTKDPLNPVMTTSEDWEAKLAYPGGTIFDGSNYHMWYSAGPAWECIIGYATSEDGSHWEKYGLPVLRQGPAGSWESQLISEASVLFDSTENKYKMWYEGFSTTGFETGGGSIGYAESSIYVEIPDTAFLYALIEEGVDTNGDSLISYEEAERITSLTISNAFYMGGGGGPPWICIESPSLASLQGIEAFTNIDTLSCECQSIESIDLSNNQKLKLLALHYNQLTSLDVSNNTALRFLRCGGNQLTSLDISNNTALVELGCWGNQLTVLDVSNNKVLRGLDISNNQLTTLDISKNTALEFLEIGGMTTLFEVCVWEGFNTNSIVNFDRGESPNVCFETNCNGVCDENTGKEESLQSEINIYPNPTYTLLTIETEFSDFYEIEITSLNGQLMLSKEMEGPTHQLDLSSFQKGVYFITIRSKDLVPTRKVIKL